MALLSLSLYLSFAQKLLAQSGGDGMGKGHAILGTNDDWQGCNGDRPKHEEPPNTPDHLIT